MTLPSRLRTVQVTRYVTPLREGGSLPAIAEADDGFLYVLKFRGAGQGLKALIAELLGGEIARVLGLRVPELVFAQLDPAFGRSEPDEEIQDLLKASVGCNLALHFLSGSVTYDPVVNKADADLAARIVWLDAYMLNVDRTARNTNMLMWQKELWLIDHGAAFYYHHAGESGSEAAAKSFPLIRDHVLLPFAGDLDEADREAHVLLTPERLRAIVSLLPDDWLQGGDSPLSPAERREDYYQFLTGRLAHSATFVKEAQDARAKHI